MNIQEEIANRIKEGCKCERCETLKEIQGLLESEPEDCCQILIEKQEEIDRLEAENKELKEGIVGHRKNSDFLAERIDQLQSQLKAQEPS